jgi:hypothetical protein
VADDDEFGGDVDDDPLDTPTNDGGARIAAAIVGCPEARLRTIGPEADTGTAPTCKTGGLTVIVVMRPVDDIDARRRSVEVRFVSAEW